jgi:signal transduction histidine kinase
MDHRGTLRVISRTTRYAPPKMNTTAGPARREADPPGIDYRLLRRTNPAKKWPFLEHQGIVEIDVLDTGPGISEANLPRVFDPFFTTKEAGRGTGLGLSVSQRIIESFYGDIQITSAPNKGTRVRIRMPVLEEDEDTLRTPITEEMLHDGTTAAHRG